MNVMQRTVLAVGVAAVVVGACWQYRAALAARDAALPDTCLESGPPDASLATSARMTRKAQAIELLVNGGLTLLEAAAYFRDLNDNPPEHRCDFRRWTPGASDGEKACRQVIEWARASLTRHPSQTEAAEIIDRLEYELAGLTAGGKAVELPW